MGIISVLWVLEPGRTAMWMYVTPLSYVAFPGGWAVTNPPVNAGDAGSTPGLGRSSGEGNGNPLQYFCLGNSMGKGNWWAAVHGVAKELDMTYQLNNDDWTIHLKIIQMLSFMWCVFYNKKNNWTYGRYSFNRNSMENPKDGRAWWAAVYGVAQSRTRLKRLSSSSSSSMVGRD